MNQLGLILQFCLLVDFWLLLGMLGPKKKGKSTPGVLAQIGPKRGSIEWANDLLRWFLREILYAETWIQHPYNKLIVGYDVIDQLEDKGFWWQSERARNHIHKWMKAISCTPSRGDLSKRGERIH